MVKYAWSKQSYDHNNTNHRIMNIHAFLFWGSPNFRLEIIIILFLRLAFIAASLKFVIKKVITNTHSHWLFTKISQVWISTNHILVGMSTLHALFLSKIWKRQIVGKHNIFILCMMYNVLKSGKSRVVDKWCIGHFEVKWPYFLKFLNLHFPGSAWDDGRS